MIRDIETGKLNRKFYCCPGDTFICKVTDSKGERTVVRSIEEEIAIDTITTFIVEEQMGVKKGIGSVFGEGR